MANDYIGPHSHGAGGDGGGILVPADRLDPPEYATDADAPNGTLYFHTADGETKYKTPDGTVLGVSADTRVAISEDGAELVANPTDLNFGSNLDAADDGDGTVTVSAPARSTVASETDDGSDVTYHSLNSISSENSPQALVDVSGSGVLIGGHAYLKSGSDGGATAVEITVDGGTTFSCSYVEATNDSFAPIPSVVFESSLQVDIFEASVNNFSAAAWVKQ